MDEGQLTPPSFPLDELSLLHGWPTLMLQLGPSKALYDVPEPLPGAREASRMLWHEAVVARSRTVATWPRELASYRWVGQSPPARLYSAKHLPGDSP